MRATFLSGSSLECVMGHAHSSKKRLARRLSDWPQNSKKASSNAQGLAVFNSRAKSCSKARDQSLSTSAPCNQRNLVCLRGSRRFFQKTAVFVPPDFIDRLVEVFGDMKTVVHDFDPRQPDGWRRRSPPHVHTGGQDLCQPAFGVALPQCPPSPVVRTRYPLRHICAVVMRRAGLGAGWRVGVEKPGF